MSQPESGLVQLSLSVFPSQGDCPLAATESGTGRYSTSHSGKPVPTKINAGRVMPNATRRRHHIEQREVKLRKTIEEAYNGTADRASLPLSPFAYIACQLCIYPLPYMLPACSYFNPVLLCARVSAHSMTYVVWSSNEEGSQRVLSSSHPSLQSAHFS